MYPIKAFFIALTLFLQCTVFHASFAQGVKGSGLLPVRMDYKWGAIDTTGTLKIPPRYHYIDDFDSLGYARIRSSWSYGLMDSLGNEILPPIYQDVRVLNRSTALVSFEGSWGIADLLEGRLVMHGVQHIEKAPFGFLLISKDSTKALYDPVKPAFVSEFYPLVQPLGKHVLAFGNGDGKIGARHVTGREIAPPRYDSLFLVTEELIVTKLDTLFGLIGIEQGVLQPDSFQQIGVWPMCDTLLLVQKHEKLGLLNRAGKFYLPLNYYEQILRLPNGALMINEPVKGWQIYTSNEKVFYQAVPYQDFEYINESFLRLTGIDKKLSIHLFEIDSTIHLNKSGISQLKEGDFLEVQTADTIFLIDNKGGVVKLRSSWKHYSFLSEGLIAVRKKSFWGIANKEGKLLVEPTLTNIYDFPEDIPVTLVQSEQKFGMLNRKGDLVLKPVYDRIEVFEGNAKAYRGNKLILLDYRLKDGILEAKSEFDQVFTFQVQLSTSEESIQFSSSAVRRAPANSPGWGSNWRTNQNRFVVRGFGPEKAFMAMIDRRMRAPVGMKEHGMFRFIYQKKSGDCIFGWRAGNTVKTTYFLKEGRYKKLKTIGYLGEFREGLARINIGGYTQINASKDSRYYLPDLFDLLNDNYFKRSLQKKSRVSTDIFGTHFGVCHEGKWGFIDSKGKLAIAPIYQFVHDFKGGQAIAKKGGKWGVINTQNNVVVPFEYDDIGYLPNADSAYYQLFNFLPLKGVIDTLGHVVIPAQFDGLASYSEGLFPVKKEGLWGFVDRKGAWAIPATFDQVKPFSKGLAPAASKGAWGIIDKKGKWKVAPSLQAIQPFSEGLAVAKTTGQYGFIDENGDWAIEPRYRDCHSFKEGAALVRERGYWGMIDTQGGWVIQPQYSKIEPFDKNGLAVAKMKGRWGILREDGSVLLPFKYFSVMPFQEGLALVRTRRKNYRKQRYGFIDYSGKKVVNFRYRYANSFHDGLARVAVKMHKWGYINTRGKWAIKPQFYDAENFSEGKGLVYTERGRKEGAIFINKEGKQILKGNYTPVRGFRDGRAAVLSGGVQNFIDSLGNFINYQNHHQVGDYHQQVALVKDGNGYWMLVDKAGLPLSESIYKHIAPKPSKQGYMEMTVDYHIGLADRNGNLVLPCTFEKMEEVGHGMYRVMQGDAIGYWRNDGTWLWPLQK